MPRLAKLRKHDGYWLTQAGNAAGVYFGKALPGTRIEAEMQFRAYLASLSAATIRADSVAMLFDDFLDSVHRHRSQRTYQERKLHLDRFAGFRRGSIAIGELIASAVRADDLTKFLESARAQYDLDDFSLHKHTISITAAFNWGAGLAKLKNPTPCLPPSFRPFAQVERIKLPPRDLTDASLPTDREVAALLEWADLDIALIYEPGHFPRSRRPDERRRGDTNPYRGFSDMLLMYFFTGARTSELAIARVGDVDQQQIVLGQHKRTKTLKNEAKRRITLKSEAFAIIKRLCKGKKPEDPIFTDPAGRSWTRLTLAARFQQVRKLAKVRDSITIYSFRHRWISRHLMQGMDIQTVAHLAGTSIAMIDKIYPHYSSKHLRESVERFGDSSPKFTEQN